MFFIRNFLLEIFLGNNIKHFHKEHKYFSYFYKIPMFQSIRLRKPFISKLICWSIKIGQTRWFCPSWRQNLINRCTPLWKEWQMWVQDIFYLLKLCARKEFGAHENFHHENSHVIQTRRGVRVMIRGICSHWLREGVWPRNWNLWNRTEREEGREGWQLLGI